MNTHYIHIITVCAVTLGVMACNNDETVVMNAGTGQHKIVFDMHYPGTETRATSTGFERDDQVGVYIVNDGKTIDLADNIITNLPFTFDGSLWKAPMTLYWSSGTYDIYSYYPYKAQVESVSDMPFSLATDQNQDNGYEQSDFLWAKTVGVQASDNAVPLQFGHRMSRLLIQLAKGEDYEGILPDDAEVYIHNTITDGTIDLGAGIVTPTAHIASKIIHARNLGGHRYTAIVMPQRLNSRVPLIEVVSHSVSYLYESKFLFKMGTQHNVLLVMSNNPDQIKIEVGGEIQQWD